MEQASDAPRGYRFGVFELDVSSGELRRVAAGISPQVRTTELAVAFRGERAGSNPPWGGQSICFLSSARRADVTLGNPMSSALDFAQHRQARIALHQARRSR
jgi:hypothetical protein